MSNQQNQQAPQTSHAAAFPIFGVLGVAFVVLKLTGVINWSWLWVLAPFWGPLAFALIVMVLYFGLLVYASSKK